MYFQIFSSGKLPIQTIMCPTISVSDRINSITVATIFLLCLPPDFLSGFKLLYSQQSINTICGTSFYLLCSLNMFCLYYYISHFLHMLHSNAAL